MVLAPPRNFNRIDCQNWFLLEVNKVNVAVYALSAGTVIETTRLLLFFFFPRLIFIQDVTDCS